MAIEAEVISVGKSGEMVDVLVEFKKDGRLLTRETLQFGPNEKLEAPVLQRMINSIGSRLDRRDESDVFARTVVGAKYQVVITDPESGLPVRPA